jgi:hypothetical protein
MREWAKRARAAYADFIRKPTPKNGYRLAAKLNQAARALELLDTYCESSTELSSTVVRDAIVNELRRIK